MSQCHCHTSSPSYNKLSLAHPQWETLQKHSPGGPAPCLSPPFPHLRRGDSRCRTGSWAQSHEGRMQPGPAPWSPWHRSSGGGGSLGTGPGWGTRRRLRPRGCRSRGGWSARCVQPTAKPEENQTLAGKSFELDGASRTDSIEVKGMDKEGDQEKPGRSRGQNLRARPHRCSPRTPLPPEKQGEREGHLSLIRETERLKTKVQIALLTRLAEWSSWGVLRLLFPIPLYLTLSTVPPRSRHVLCTPEL